MSLNKPLLLSFLFLLSVSSVSAATLNNILQSLQQPPTATLTANSSHSIVVSPGDTVTYVWSSTNADKFSSNYVGTPSYCGSGVWNLTTPNGTQSGVISSSQIGCTYTMNYTGTQSSTGKSVTDSITIKVLATPTPVQTITLASSSVQPGASVSISWNFTSGNNPNDWIVIAPVGGNYVVGNTSWKLTGGAKSGTITINAPTTPGTYDVVFDHDNIIETTRLSKALTVVLSTPPVPLAPPTALLTGNNSHSITVYSGDTITYVWSSTNADKFTSSYVGIPASCGSGVWNLTTANGTQSGVIAPSQVGCTYTMIYNAIQSSTNASSSNGVSIKVIKKNISAPINLSSIFDYKTYTSNISWTNPENTGATQVVIERFISTSTSILDSSSVFTVIGTSTLPSSTFSDKSLPYFALDTSSTVQYRVKAIGTTVESPYSSLSTLQQVYAPQNLDAQYDYYNLGTNLTWTNVTNTLPLKEIQIERSISNGDFSLIGTTSPALSSYFDNSVPTSTATTTEIWYRTKLVSSTGVESDYSNYSMTNLVSETAVPGLFNYFQTSDQMRAMEKSINDAQQAAQNTPAPSLIQQMINSVSSFFKISTNSLNNTLSFGTNGLANIFSSLTGKSNTADMVNGVNYDGDSTKCCSLAYYEANRYPKLDFYGLIPNDSAHYSAWGSKVSAFKDFLESAGERREGRGDRV